MEGVALIIGEASDGPEAVQKAVELKPDLILLDLGLPTMNGIEVARRFPPDLLVFEIPRADPYKDNRHTGKYFVAVLHGEVRSAAGLHAITAFSLTFAYLRRRVSDTLAL
jgi:hypothetical protein